VSGAGLHGDESLERLVAWGRARTARRALDVAGESGTALTITLGEVTRVRLVVGDVGALPFDNAAFDLVTCHRVAHHFPHAALAVREIQRVLAPGGSLLLAEPLGHEDGDTAGDTPAVRAYRRPEWHAFLRAAGLTVMEEDTIAASAAPAPRIILLRAEKD
jgi:ubiquinone/menaquinone biosynthesis C-methylase UbiE